MPLVAQMRSMYGNGVATRTARLAELAILDNIFSADLAARRRRANRGRGRRPAWVKAATAQVKVWRPCRPQEAFCCIARPAR
jgi:hypothetical protein